VSIRIGRTGPVVEPPLAGGAPAHGRRRRGAILHHDDPRRTAVDATFRPRSLHVSAGVLAAEGLSATFVDDMRRWKGFVAEAEPSLDDEGRRWHWGVAHTDVDLDLDGCARELSRDEDADASVAGFLADGLTNDAGRVEDHAVLRAGHRGDRLEDLDDAVHLGAAAAKEVEILNGLTGLTEEEVAWAGGVDIGWQTL